ncbi:MAG: hypothetical protein J4F41_00255 [Alphaproteobacteria bacterium]|nr:hypothetical protein [Alphaproteobacteria bacterium]
MGGNFNTRAILSIGVAVGVGYLTGGLGIAAAGSFWATSAGAAVFYGGLATAAVLLAPKLPQPPAFNDPGRELGLNSGAQYRRIVYGRMRVPLTATFIDADGANNSTLVQVFPIADGPIEGAAIWFDDAIYTEHDGTADVRITRGRFNVTADTALTAASRDIDWSATRIGAGVALAFIELEYDRDDFAGGIPRLTAVVDGALLWDPRDTGIVITGASGNVITTATPHLLAVGAIVWLSGHADWGRYEVVAVASQTTLELMGLDGQRVQPGSGAIYLMHWSNNAAMCILDQVIRAARGKPDWVMLSKMIDIPSFETAADICDEYVTLADTTQQRRYTVDGVVSSAEAPGEALRDMLAACGGMLVRRAGALALVAGAGRDAEVTITEDDIIGDVAVNRFVPKSSLFNAINGTISAAEKDWAATVTPLVANATYAAEDGGQIIFKQDLRFVTDITRAQRLHKIALEKHRQTITVQLPVKPKLGWLTPGDVVNLTIDRFTWDAKPFMVTAVDSGPHNEAKLTLTEHTAAVYDWNAGEETTIDLAPNISIPDPTMTLPVTGLVVTAGDDEIEQFQDGTTVLRIRASWVVPADGYVERIEIQWQGAGETSWNSRIVSAAVTESYITNPIAGADYAVRVRAINVFGAASAWVQASVNVLNEAGPPDAPSALTVIRQRADGVDILIGGTTARDLSHYELRYTVAQLGETPAAITSEGDWTAAAVLERRSAVPVIAGQDWAATVFPPGTGNYRIYARAVDRTGNLSAISANASDTTAFLDQSGIVAYQARGRGVGWDGVSWTNMINGADNLLLPLAGIIASSVEQSNQIFDVDIWNDSDDWLLTPTLSESVVTMPEIELDSQIDATLRFDTDLFYPPDRAVAIEPLIQRQFRQRHDGTWSAWADMALTQAICADRVQVRVKILHDTAGDPRRSFGLSRASAAVTVFTTSTPPATATVAVAATGVVITFPQTFIQPPLVTANVTSVASGSIDDYEVAGLGTATTTGVTLYIRHKSTQTLTTGSLQFEATGLI